MRITLKIPDINNLLFGNHSLKQTIFKNTFWLTIGTGASRILNFVLMIYVVRILGVAEYGKFSFALAFVSLFTVVADLGVSTILVREFAKNKEREKEFYSLISLKIILGLAMLGLVIAGSFLITPDSVIRKIIFILAFFSLINSFIDTSYAFFQARQKMEYQAVAAILGAVLLAILGFFVVFYFPNAENLSTAFLLANLITLLFLLIFFHLKIFPLKIRWEKTIWQKFLAISWPLAFTSFFGLLYTYIDSVMLGYFGQIRENGFYNAAYRIAWMSYIFTGLAVTSFYPILSRAFGESKEKLQRVWNYQMELMTAFAIPLMIGGIILAPRIIGFLYGAEFLPSVLALQILIVMSGILLLAAAFLQVLIVANHQKKLILATLFGAVVNIALNIILIPKYSFYGAAFASCVTQLLIFFLLFIFTLKFTSIRFPDLRFLIFLA
ncbi:MAG: flippase, partial [Candidatus Azambacteria bacterium]|nr:flippase [Candidatus Azambacteria bacterium]